MPGPVGPDDPVLRRLGAWSRERFPLVPIVVLSATTVASVAAAAAAIAGAPVRFDPGLALCALGHVLTLLLLRLLDEHKDHAKDVQAYPERALSRGVVTLPLLGRLAWVVAAVAVACSAALGVVPLVAYAVVVVFALLMAKEFFIGRVLERDVFAYALAHQPINPLVTLWLFLGVAAREARLADVAHLVPAALAPYVVAQVALGFGFEIARKVWTPAEEQPDLVQSYSSHRVGPRGAAAIALALLVLGTALTGVFAQAQGLPLWCHVPIDLCAALALLSVGRFMLAPFPGASKKLQAAVGLGALLLQGGLIAGAIAHLGARFTLALGAGA